MLDASEETVEEQDIEDEDDETIVHDSKQSDFDDREAAAFIWKEAVQIASSIVTTCLTQLCVLNSRKFVVTDNDEASAAEGARAEPTLNDEDYFEFRKAHKAVLLDN
ncbi:hypothetical protein ACROYT_G015543 [Oculina patagonica]